MRVFITHTKKDEKNGCVYTRNVRFANLEDYQEALTLANDMSKPGLEPLVEDNTFYPSLTPVNAIAGTFGFALKKGKNTSFSFKPLTLTKNN